VSHATANGFRVTGTRLDYNPHMARRKRKSKSKQDAPPVQQAEPQPGADGATRYIEIELEIEELTSLDLASPIESQLQLPSASGSAAPESFETEPAAFSVPESPRLDLPVAPADIAAPNRNQSGPARSHALAPPLTPADRRTHPRYAFKAVAEVVAPESGARGSARVIDLSLQVCYLDTDAPQPLKATLEVRTSPGAPSMQAQALVVYSQPGKGMGLMFTSLDHAQSQILYAWIAESRETSWLANNRRRSQRVVMKLPVRLSAEAGPGLFEEEDTYTLMVSAHGALIASAAPLYRGQHVTLSNVQTKGSIECVVAHIDKAPGEQTKVGVEFLLPNPMFWHVAFPPKDWTPRHPDAKARR